MGGGSGDAAGRASATSRQRALSHPRDSRLASRDKRYFLIKVWPGVVTMSIDAFERGPQTEDRRIRLLTARRSETQRISISLQLNLWSRIDFQDSCCDPSDYRSFAKGLSCGSIDRSQSTARHCSTERTWGVTITANCHFGLLRKRAMIG